MTPNQPWASNAHPLQGHPELAGGTAGYVLAEPQPSKVTALSVPAMSALRKDILGM